MDFGGADHGPEHERLVVVTAVGGSALTVTPNEHVRVPAAIRRWCGLELGSRVLLVADPPLERLVIHPTAALDAISQASRLYLRSGFRTTALIGGAVTIMGTILTTVFTADASIATIGLACFVVGAVHGRPARTRRRDRYQHVRALGVALFGTIVNATLRGSATTAALTAASSHVFIAVVVMAVLMGMAVYLMPKIIQEPPPADPDETDRAEFRRRGLTVP